MGFRDIGQDVDRVLISEEELREAVARLARQIDEDEKNSEKGLLLLGILKGSVVFMGDLMKQIKTPMEIDFMKVSSYGASTVSSGELKITLDLMREDLDRYDVVIVEDIVDSGNTLSKLVSYLRGRGAGSVRACALLDKPARRKVDYTPDYVGIVVPDVFVIGYGLDYDEKYRELPYVGVLKKEIYEK